MVWMLSEFVLRSSLLQSSLLSLFLPALLQQTTADTDMCDITFAVSYSLSLSPPPLSESLSESALILPSIVPSPPITQNQEKHTPTRDWGSDKIKRTRSANLDYRSTRHQNSERFWALTERQRQGVCRVRKEGTIAEKKQRIKEWQRKRESTHDTERIRWPFHNSSKDWLLKCLFFLFFSPIIVPPPLFNKTPIWNCAHMSASEPRLSNV